MARNPTPLAMIVVLFLLGPSCSCDSENSQNAIDEQRTKEELLLLSYARNEVELQALRKVSRPRLHVSSAKEAVVAAEQALKEEGRLFESNRPFHATLDNEVWTVQGQLTANGTPQILIDKKQGVILRITNMFRPRKVSPQAGKSFVATHDTAKKIANAVWSHAWPGKMEPDGPMALLGGKWNTEGGELTINEVNGEVGVVGRPTPILVPDASTAIRLAEAVLIPIYGEGAIAAEQLSAGLRDRKTWVIQGRLPFHGSIMAGGVAYVEIERGNGQIIFVTHGK